MAIMAIELYSFIPRSSPDISEEFKTHLQELAPLLLSRKNLIPKKINGDNVTCMGLLEYFQVSDIEESSHFPLFTVGQVTYNFDSPWTTVPQIHRYLVSGYTGTPISGYTGIQIHRYLVHRYLVSGIWVLAVEK